MKKSLLIYLITLFSSFSFAQKLKEKKEDIDFMFRAEYHVLEVNKKVKQGIYTIFSKQSNNVVVRGNFDNNFLTGTWMFFDYNGNLEQRYNFNDEKLIYNHFKIDSNSLSYQFPIGLTSKDTIVAPIKIGGLFYGCSFVNIPIHEFSQYMLNNSIEKSKINHYFDIDENGKLVSWKSIIEANGKVFVQNIHSLPEFFKLFIPARVSNKKIASTMIYSTILSVSSNIR
jgi:hypothetical protein